MSARVALALVLLLVVGHIAPAGARAPQGRGRAAAKSQSPAPPQVRNSPDQAWTERVVPVPIVGHVVAYVPKAPVSSVVLFLSGDGRWNLGVITWARRIMPKAIVLGVDYVALKNAHRSSTTCWLPAGDLEEISHTAQKTLGLPEYHAPIVVGYSSGATLVYGVLAAAPPQTFSGGLSLGFCPDLPALQPVCPAEGFRPTFDAKKSTAWLPKVSALPHDWYVLNGELDQVCLPPQVHQFLDGIQNAHFVEIPHTGHGFGKPAYWSKPFDESTDALIRAASAVKPAAAAPRSSAALQSALDGLKLPLEYRWPDELRAALIFVSGDGGWATLDDRVAAYLASHGVAVVGVSSLRYFWSVKTPEQTGADLRRIADVLGGARVPLFVGGYSFGAEVAPFALESWPDAARRGVAGQVLIAPGETASFEISPLDWVLRARDTPHRVADGVRRAGVPALCVAGTGEAARDTACDDLGASADVERLPGSHHFNGKYEDVGKVVLTFIDKHR